MGREADGLEKSKRKPANATVKAKKKTRILDAAVTELADVEDINAVKTVLVTDAGASTISHVAGDSERALSPNIQTLTGTGDYDVDGGLMDVDTEQDDRHIKLEARNLQEMIAATGQIVSRAAGPGSGASSDDMDAFFGEHNHKFHYFNTLDGFIPGYREAAQRVGDNVTVGEAYCDHLSLNKDIVILWENADPATFCMERLLGAEYDMLLAAR